MTAPDTAGALDPPPYLREDLRDLLIPPSPRLVVVTQRRLMERYHSLEEGELGMRQTATREHWHACNLWLQALDLYHSAFVDVGEWGDLGADLPEKEREALELRTDLLALAGTASKPALDTILAGYYWSAYGMIRSLLETCRRVGFVRRRGEAALKWFQLPAESPIGPDGRPRPRKDRPKPLPGELVEQAFEDAPETEKWLFDTVKTGIFHFHGGAHPSPEGILQLYAGDELFKVFGPNYHRPFCAFGLKWGLIAHHVLLLEIQWLRPQAKEWIGRFDAFVSGLAEWEDAYIAEFQGEPGWIGWPTAGNAATPTP